MLVHLSLFLALIAILDYRELDYRKHIVRLPAVSQAKHLRIGFPNDSITAFFYIFQHLPTATKKKGEEGHYKADCKLFNRTVN